ncbi:MAG: TolC family protein [Phycisphaeraceae bacterium]|nr:TolC family protein [Phycisphaeraceae bacterium]
MGAKRPEASPGAMAMWRTWLSLSAVALAAGCSLNPRWPDPEAEAARLAGQAAIIKVDETGGVLDAPAFDAAQLGYAQAIRESLTHAPAIQAALARVRQAYAAAEQERLLPNPVLTVALKLPVGGGSPTVEPGLAAELMNLLLMPGRVDAADHRLRAAGAEALAVTLDVLAQVQRCYIQVQALDASMPVLEERRRLTERMLDIARSRLQGGEGTRLDVTTLEAQRIEMDEEIAEQELARQEARLELARLIGRPGGGIDWLLDAQGESAATPGDEKTWLRAALEHRPEIAVKTWELKALGVDLRQTRWSLLEDAGVGVEAEGTARSDADDWQVGPAWSVPLPLFDWGQARRDLLRARRLETSHQRNQIRREVIEEVRRAYAACEASRKACQRVGGLLIPLLERRRREAESQYQAGQCDVMALILADQDLQTARMKLIELHRRAAESFVRLRRAAGGPGEPGGPTVKTRNPTGDPAIDIHHEGNHP